MGISNLKEKIDLALKNYFENKGDYNKNIYKSMAYSINIGGKRIRPILTMLTYGIYKTEIDDILDIAMAIEMIHTYSLIHDDLPAMDNDTLRRGKPTNHVVFGQAVAILAGDSLLNEAMILLMEYAQKHGVEALNAAIVISKAAGADGMIGGQLVDIESEGKGKDLTIEELNYMHKNKTGALIKASIIAGALVAKANEDDIRKFYDFGEKLGLAFQIKDDILDVTQSTQMLGKTAHSDSANEKTNYISIYGLEKCQEICRNLTHECIDLLDGINGDVEALKELTLKLLDRKN